MAPIGAFIGMCPIGVVLYYVYHMARAKRLGNIQFFLRSHQKEDNRYLGAQVGLMTYDKDDNYNVSYVEAGFRCDHLVEPIIRRGPTGGTVTNASSPLEYDADLIRPNPVDEAVRKAAAEQTADINVGSAQQEVPA